MCELNVSLSIAIKFAMADCNFKLMVLVVIISGDDLRGNYPRGEFGVELFTSGFAFNGLFMNDFSLADLPLMQLYF